MEPVVDVMADLLSAVSTVITSFTSWLSSLTTALIGNPAVQIMFAIAIIFTVSNFVIGLIKGRRGKKRRR